MVENKNIETEINKENSKLKEKNNNLIKFEKQKKLEENKSKINKPNHSFSKSNPFINNEYTHGYNKIIKIENITDKTYISRNNININRSYRNNNNELSSKTNKSKLNNNEKENIGKNIQEQLININKYQDQNNINKLNHSHKFKKILFILYYFILVFFRIFFTLV